MKRKRVEQVEKRRPTVEPNLLGRSSARSIKRARGCASLLSRLMAGSIVALILLLGLR